jgi:hypothetical protein
VCCLHTGGGLSGKEAILLDAKSCSNEDLKLSQLYTFFGRKIPIFIFVFSPSALTYLNGMQE